MVVILTPIVLMVVGIPGHPFSGATGYVSFREGSAWGWHPTWPTTLVRFDGGRVVLLKHWPRDPGYMGWNPSQAYRDYFIRAFWGSPLTNQEFMECHKVLITAQLVPNKNVAAAKDGGETHISHDSMSWWYSYLNFELGTNSKCLRENSNDHKVTGYIFVKGTEFPNNLKALSETLGEKHTALQWLEKGNQVHGTSRREVMVVVSILMSHLIPFASK